MSTQLIGSERMCCVVVEMYRSLCGVVTLTYGSNAGNGKSGTQIWSAATGDKAQHPSLVRHIPTRPERGYEEL